MPAFYIKAGQLSGSASSPGRAVEGMLRAVIWKRDPEMVQGRKSLGTGHDLRELLTHVRNLGLLSGPDVKLDELESVTLHIARLWFNNMRYASSRFVETRWYNIGEVHKNRTFKQAAESCFMGNEY